MVESNTIRAPLFVPANRPERFVKAAQSGCDAVIIDLEDAVADADKARARDQVRTDFTDLPVMVRVNAVGTPWHAADVAAMKGHGIAALMLPKAEDPAAIAALSQALGAALPVIALVESAKGLAHARAIAALPGVARLAFGSIDYCADLGCAHERDALLAARAELVLASRLAGKPGPLDGVTAQVDDEALAHDDARHARTMGMGGKLCVHPRQIGPVLRAFAPSAEEMEWARRVLATGEGAVRVDGAMVDEPVRIRARAILAAGSISG